MPWYLVTVQEEFVTEPASIRLRTTGDKTVSLKGELVIGQYKRGSGEDAMEDAAKEHGLSPFVLNSYSLMD